MTLEVIAPGPLATIQDLGRPGLAHVGVAHSGAADRNSLRLANRLVGNPESAAGIEATMGGIRLRAHIRTLICVTGAHTTVTVDDTPVGMGTSLPVQAGSILSVGAPRSGCRSYVAVRGGIVVPTVLGSRSTDTLSGLGPAPLRAGDVLPVGDPPAGWPPATMAPIGTEHSPLVDLDTFSGPRRHHLHNPSDLYSGTWQVSAEADRIGVRLRRPKSSAAPHLTHRGDSAQLRSEGVAHGSVQIPPNGQPVIFLADHPVTGGYPVVAVLSADALCRAAQLVAGEAVRFRAR